MTEHQHILINGFALEWLPNASLLLTLTGLDGAVHAFEVQPGTAKMLASQIQKPDTDPE